MTAAPLPMARSGIFGLLPTVVQVTAEAGVGFYFRGAGGTALWVTDRLGWGGALGVVLAAPRVQRPQVDVSGSKDAVHNGTAERGDHTEADEDDRCNQHLSFVFYQV